MRSITYEAGVIYIIDQTLLPGREKRIALRSTVELAEAIKKLRVRGAPALGIVGAYGLAQAAVRSRSANAAGLLRDVEKAGRVLAATRPTAVNLGWAIDRTLAAAGTHTATAKIRRAIEEEAHAIAREDERACLAMAELGQRFVQTSARIMTHCNTGFLSTGGYGTALGVIRLAHESGKNPSVLATETRPLLQGARLTAWELARLGIAHELVPDGAAPALIARGEVDVVIVGADRIATNGDVANKIGTYSLALAARAAKVPFIVVAPTSTVDLSIPSGRSIVVEERPRAEVTSVLGRIQIAPKGTRARNPAFDVTPSSLVSVIVTEVAIVRPVNRAMIAKLFESRSRQNGRRGLSRK